MSSSRLKDASFRVPITASRGGPTGPVLKHSHQTKLENWPGLAYAPFPCGETERAVLARGEESFPRTPCLPTLLICQEKIFTQRFPRSGANPSAIP